MAVESEPSFGDQLRRLRQVAGLSQEELAERAGLTAAAVGALERGNRRHPYPHTLQLLADALGLASSDRARFFLAVPRRGSEDEGTASEGRSADATTGLLPPQPTPLVGREDDLARVGGLVLQSNLRLLTLTGAGGTGKTRLAVAIAESVADAFPDGVAFVDLAPIDDPALVPRAVGQSCGVADNGRQPLMTSLQRKLRSRSMLLVLDNFEHVLAAAVEIAHLLETCQALKILVTSREPLRLRWEQEYQVPPLRTPEQDYSGSIDALAVVPAVALFVTRARAVLPDFHLAPANAEAVATLCRRLDGLPLAIELAAARVKILPPQALLNRLERRLDLLETSARDTPLRHRTLRAAIDWSVGLLAADERKLFQRLAVFAGGWTLEAAEEVGVMPGEELDVLSGLGSLVDKNLVQRDDVQADEPRFRLLETVRAYALESLERSGEEANARRRHAEHFTALVEGLDADLFAARPAALRLVAREHDNTRAALGWLVEQREKSLALRLSASQYFVWITGGHIAEGLRWLEAILAIPGPNAPPSAWARAMAGRAGLLMRAGDIAEGHRRAREAIAAARLAGDHRALGHAHFMMSLAELIRGDDNEAMKHLDAARDVPQEGGSRYFEAIGLPLIGILQERAGRIAQARDAFERSHRLFRSSGHSWGLARCLDYWSSFELRQGERDRAGVLAREALRTHRALGSVWVDGDSFETLASVLVTAGNADAAARLVGFAAALAEVYDPTAATARGRDQSPAGAAALSLLGQEAYGAAWEAGHSLHLADAIVLALATSEPGNSSPAVSAAPARKSARRAGETTDRITLLTPREREVVTRIARGMTSREIAAALVISEATADKHAENVREKLGLRSRAEIAAWAVEHGLLAKPSE
jgi:predicted ATPase/DNA-binding CsgD family transcriptional regulator/transcriptional regulator with XRE-family HTH domain